MGTSGFRSEVMDGGEQAATASRLAASASRERRLPEMERCMGTTSMGVGRRVAWVENELEILPRPPGFGTPGRSLTPPVPPPILPPASSGSPPKLVRVPESPLTQRSNSSTLPPPGAGRGDRHAPHIDTGVHVKLNHRWTALRSLLLVGLAAGTVAGCNEAEPAEPTPTPTGTARPHPELPRRGHLRRREDDPPHRPGVGDGGLLLLRHRGRHHDLQGRRRRRAVRLLHRHLERRPGQRHPRQAGKRRPLAAGGRVAGPREHLSDRL